MLRTLRLRPTVRLQSTKTAGISIETPNDDDVSVRIKVQPIKRTNESIQQKKARLMYQSRKRGILETDLLLSRFAKKYLNDMSEAQLKEYDELLDELDWDIYYWATKNYDVTPLPDKWKNSQILLQLQEMSQNKERDVLRMPELTKEDIEGAKK